MTANEIPDYLRSRLGPELKVRSVKRTYPGMSRETWLVDATLEGAPNGLVLRIDPEDRGFTPPPFTLKREYRVYERLQGSSVAVPKTLWFDDSGDYFGGRARAVRELVEGTTDPPDLPPQEIANELVTALAAVHTLDWKSRGFADILPAPVDQADCASHEMRLWRDVWERYRPEADPMVTRAFAWLAEQAPATAPAVNLLKGNNGVGEELWANGHVVAMSDWEVAGLGDPSSDLANAQDVFTMADEQVTLQTYEQLTGYRIDPHNLAWYRAWILVKNLIVLRCGVYFFGRARRPRPALASIGLGSGAAIAHMITDLCGMDVLAASDRVRRRRRGRGD